MAESIKMLPNSREDGVCIEIEKSVKLLAAKMGEKIYETFPLSSKCCIYRVPKAIYKVSKNAYVPQAVSIGPFHRGKESLQATERFKWLYLKSLLGRVLIPHTNLLECLIEAIKKLEKDSRECYEEDINLSSDEFVEMMLIDGCFILEMFRREAREAEADEALTDKETDDEESIDKGVDDEVSTEEEDPVFRTAHMQSKIRRDLILLENQIPLLILQRLFDLTTDPEHKGGSLNDLCLKSLNYFKEIVPMDKEIDRRKPNLKPKHLLDLLRSSFIPPTIQLKHAINDIFHLNTVKYINCAIELDEAGVTFKKEENPKSLFNITFGECTGVFKIPPLRVEDSTETLFRNLIAFEQRSGHSDLITSYVLLMDNLISSTEDVQLLRNEGIIINSLGSDQEASNVINKLCKEVVLQGFHFTKLCEDVKKYYGNPYHKWQATLKREYFNTPWKVLSFIVAILLLILTTAGTLFAILSYLVHRS